MICIRLIGGLGNQLFQYAFARSLAHDLNKELFIDISYFNFNVHVKHIIFALNAFKIKGIIGNFPYTKPEVNSLLFDGNLNLYENGGILTKWGFFDSNAFKNIDKIETPSYFTGYFSNGFDGDLRLVTENFFVHNEKIIKEDLTLAYDLPEEYEKIIEDMLNYDAVAIHFRRGDDYKNISRFGTCSAEYYEEAIKDISKKLDNPKFYIFTEDHDWVKENIFIPFPHEHIFFDEMKNEVSRGYVYLLKLMSCCDHFIIANSTFSWWGAWLSDNPNKLIYSPKPWFQSREILKVDTINNVKPISILNNYRKLFDDSKLTLLSFEDLSFKEVNNCHININNGEIIIQDINDNSEIILNPIYKEDNNRASIIKISLKTNEAGILRLFYQTNQDCEFKDNQSLYLYYYENESFDHYFILPDFVKLNCLMIKPSLNSNVSSLKITSFEVKETTLENNDFFNP